MARPNGLDEATDRVLFRDVDFVPVEAGSVRARRGLQGGELVGLPVRDDQGGALVEERDTDGAAIPV